MQLCFIIRNIWFKICSALSCTGCMDDQLVPILITFYNSINELICQIFCDQDCAIHGWQLTFPLIIDTCISSFCNSNFHDMTPSCAFLLYYKYERISKKEKSHIKKQAAVIHLSYLFTRIHF